MTHVCYWNINNFSLNKIFRPGAGAAAAQATNRLNHIVAEVLAPAPPDIFIVAEVFGRVREVGLQGLTLSPGRTAGAGVLRLLGAIRGNNALGDAWCVVPPLTLGELGFREGMAVFYNAATVQFTGPYVWAQPPDSVFDFPQAVPTAGNLGALKDYDGLWKAGLPTAAPVPPNLRGRTWNVDGTAVPESQFAAQWEHYAKPEDGGHRLNWPGSVNRSPYYTRFREVANPNRMLKVFAIHTSPKTAVPATRDLPLIPQLAPADGEVSIVIGDFNVDSFDMGRNGAYAPLADGGFRLLLDPRNAQHAVDGARKPYCMTHMLPPSRTHKTVTVTVATPFNAQGVLPDPQHNVYPRFGYTGSIIADHISDSGAIDNAFVGYGPNLNPPGDFQVSIINTVVGKPYAAKLGIGPELTGGQAYNQGLATAIPNGGVNPPVDTINFTAWNNLGRIYSTSDHFALRAFV
jgi:hypothetical protein